MGFIKNDDVVAYRVDGEIVCANGGCMTKKEMDAFMESDVIYQNEVENADGVYFCDRCKKRI
jgi:hypothetical protein